MDKLPSHVLFNKASEVYMSLIIIKLLYGAEFKTPYVVIKLGKYTYLELIKK